MGHDMQKIKVLVINTNPMIYDGIMSAILNYTENMDKSGLLIDFVAVNYPEASICNRIKGMDSKLYIIPYRTKRPLKYIFHLFRLIKKNRYTIVHIHGSSCIMAIEMTAAKLAGTESCPHSHSTNCQHKLAHWLFKPLFNLLYKNGFACSVKAGHWLYRNKYFEVINNGINVDKYSFNEIDRKKYRKQYGLKEDEIGIINIAHFTEVKNHVFLVNVFKKVIEQKRKYKLLLLGQGITKDRIEEMVKKYGLQKKVIFMGVVQNVPELLSACDLMVLPSLYEGFPFTAIEAQASGIKCLVSDKVTSKCCFSDFFEYLELEEKIWVSKILDISNNYDRTALCNKNKSNIKNSGYDIKAISNRLKDLYIQYGN